MKEKIIDIIKDACAITEDITEESCLKELSLDSLSFIEVVVKIEKTFAGREKNAGKTGTGNPGSHCGAV